MRIWRWLIVLLMATALHAQYVTLQGSVVGPDGAKFNGAFALSLARPATDTCNPGTPVPTSIIIPVANGSMSQQIIPTPCLNPMIPYFARLIDSTNQPVYSDNWDIPQSLTGTIDVGDLGDVQLASGITVAIPFAIISTPTKNQTVTQPNGTALYVNYLVVTGSCTGCGGSGAGTVAPGVIGQLGYYAANGTTISGLNVGSGLSITSGTLNASGVTALSALTDVNVTEGAGIDQYFLKWDNASSKWIASVGAGGATALSGLSDVNVTEGAGIDQYFLKYDNATSKWIASAGVAGGGTVNTGNNYQLAMYASANGTTLSPSGIYAYGGVATTLVVPTVLAVGDPAHSLFSTDQIVITGIIATGSTDSGNYWITNSIPNSLAAGASNNIALGSVALQSNTTGSGNIAIGTSALVVNTTGYNNVAIGYASGSHITTGNYNVIVGEDAMEQLVTGNFNIAIGYNAMGLSTGVVQDTAVGQIALRLDTGGTNSAFGANALSSNTTGVLNVGMGLDTLNANTTGSYNTAVGAGAGYNGSGFPTDASYSTYIGYGTGPSTDHLDEVLVIGYNAQATQSYQTVLGSNGTTQTVIGGIQLPMHLYYAAGGSQVLTACNSTIVGAEAVVSDIGSLSLTSVYSPSAGLGTSAAHVECVYDGSTYFWKTYGDMFISTFDPPSTAGGNLWIGGGGTASVYDGVNVNSGSNNTAIGIGASQLNTTGHDNTVLGAYSLYDTTTGADNTVLGSNALEANVAGVENTVVGAFALNQNINISGGNTAVGYEAATSWLDLSYDTFIGYQATSSVDSVTNSIAIGYGVQVTASNQTVVGNVSTTQTVLHGALSLPEASGVTTSIGGSALTSTQCATGTVTLTLDLTGHPGIAAPSDGSDERTGSGGTGYYLPPYVFVSGTTATVEVCALTPGTPTAVTYNVVVF